MPDSTRITQVIGGLGGGGAERVCVNLANAWAGGGRAVTVVTKSEEASIFPLDARVQRRAFGRARADSIATVLRTLDDVGCSDLLDNAAAISLMRDTIVATEPDVVVSHMDITNVRVLAALRGSGIPVIACEHTDATRVPGGRWTHARDVLYREAAAVVATHPAIAEFLARRGAPAVAIANPLVAPAARDVKQSARRRLVALTRFSVEKRPEMIVRAFEKIAAAHPQWDLEIYGEGPLRHSVRRVVDELSLRGRIHLRGFADDAYDVLLGADLFVSASCVEGFGNAIWEALACGVPVVAMECGAPVRSLLRDGVDGILVGTESTTALAKALASLMGDDARRAAMASRAPEVVERYSIESSLRAWEAVIGHA
jgi:GalNAc-alpha-(1->4)-GalNAc-alpha-(1->3)-diNAcBac-PP-undecaprenol alpha-1,4-N-acetyl-D-galactosaminyltransferase